jgi:hypothetical protein
VSLRLEPIATTWHNFISNLLINITEREVPLILVSTGMMNNKSFIETLNRLCLKTQQNDKTPNNSLLSIGLWKIWNLKCWSLLVTATKKQQQDFLWTLMLLPYSFLTTLNCHIFFKFDEQTAFKVLVAKEKLILNSR